MTSNEVFLVAQGADYSYEADARCNAADPIVKAWFTVKTAISLADGSATIQKVVTTLNAPGTGQIAVDGSATNGAAVMRFDLTAADTAALSPRDYLADVKCKTASGAAFFAAGVLVRVSQSVTIASS